MDVPQVQTLIWEGAPAPSRARSRVLKLGLERSNCNFYIGTKPTGLWPLLKSLWEEQAAIAASDVGVGGAGQEQARKSSREHRQVIRD